MSTALITTDTDGTDVVDLTGVSPAELAAMLGQSSEANNTIGIPRVFVNIESEIKEDDKDIEVPIKTLGMRHPDKGVVFLKTPTVRMLMNRFMYRRWDNDDKKWCQISTMIESYLNNAEAPDTLGMVNCGKSNRFIDKDEWATMSKDMQDYQKGAKLTRVLYMIVSGTAVDLEGKSFELEPTLAVWFIGRANFKIVGAPIAAINKKKAVLPQYNQSWTFVINKDGPRPVGEVVIAVDYSAALQWDQATLASLATALEDIKGHNAYVMQEYNKVLRSANDSAPANDVSDFIDVDTGGAAPSNTDLDDEIPF